MEEERGHRVCFGVKASLAWQGSIIRDRILAFASVNSSSSKTTPVFIVEMGKLRHRGCHLSEASQPRVKPVTCRKDQRGMV